MKNIKLILGLFVFGFTLQSFTQEIEILDVHIQPASYKYLDKDQKDDAEVNPAEPVKIFQQQRAAIFTLASSKYYEDDYGFYFLSFYIPEGKILASYDADENVLRTVEKLKNTEVPSAIAKAIVKKYPGWTVSDYVYLVNHHEKGIIHKKEYKILLEKGSLRKRVRTDENGNFIKPEV